MYVANCNLEEKASIAEIVCVKQCELAEKNRKFAEVQERLQEGRNVRRPGERTHRAKVIHHSKLALARPLLPVASLIICSW